MPCACGRPLFLAEQVCFSCRDKAAERFGQAMRPLLSDARFNAHIHAATHAAMTRTLEAVRAYRRSQVR